MTWKIGSYEKAIEHVERDLDRERGLGERKRSSREIQNREKGGKQVENERERGCMYIGSERARLETKIELIGVGWKMT